MDFSEITSDSFPKEYYNFMYGGIHNLDEYAISQADILISLYGKAKYLDVGCSCGALVKELRDRGYEAWGIDISAYAMSESHAPDFIKQASVDDIPFPDKTFDVVFSRVSLGYTDDLNITINELRRVGHKQFHTIDMNCKPPAFGYKVIQSQEWWLKNFPENAAT